MLLVSCGPARTREFQHAVNADARETPSSCHHHPRARAAEHATADRRVFALGVLAHHPEVVSPGLRPASVDGTPGISRTGRRLTYWSNSRRTG